MKLLNKTVLFALALMFVSNLGLFANEAILKAMRDEMNRTMKELKIENLDKPYYVEYSLSMKQSYETKAKMGALSSSDVDKYARLNVSVRVGDYKLDNTNFLDFSSFFFGSDDDEERFTGRMVALNMDYATLRRELWLATDAAYKSAVEVYAKKLASMQNKLRKDSTPDFIKLSPEKVIDTMTIPQINMDKYREMVQSVSAQFIKYPELYSSQVSFEYVPETVYYVNSEGREYIKNNMYSGIEIAAFTQAEDGMPITDFYSVYAINPNDLPAKDSVMKAGASVIKSLLAAKQVKGIDEAYSGPVLFSSQAAGEIFAQVFAPQLITQREMMTEQGKQSADKYSAFQNKIGGRVLPEFFSVNAKPNTPKFENVPLYGYYKYDDQGVRALDVLLVKDGYLKTLLSGRVPTKRVKESNGHHRGAGAISSNLILSADDEHSKSYKELKEKMMTLCKDRELPYGIIVKKIMNPNIFMTALYGLSSGLLTPKFNKMMPPVEAYKVYPDGKEELIRGVEIGNMTAQSFKDIILAGKSNYVLNFLMPSVTQTGSFGGSRYANAAVVVPDLLFEDAEIKPNDDDYPKLPFFANPIK